MSNFSVFQHLFSGFLRRTRDGHVKLANGRELYCRLQAAEPSSPTVVLLHGLGDRLEDLENLARQFEAIGFGTLRVDLHGHGRTLELQQKKSLPVPSIIDYRWQVDDIESLIARLRLQEVILVGHSYGGGIALALASRLEKSGNLNSLHLLAPYVIRLDAYFKLKLFGNDLFMGLFSAPLTLRQKFRDYNGTTGALPDAFMASQYEKYFLQKKGKREHELTEAERAWIRALVQSSIAATRGIRGLNAFHESFNTPRETPFHLILGEADPLVPAELLIEYRDHLLEKGLAIETTVLERADHFFPQTRTAEVFERIMEVVRLRCPAAP
ncbi:MAG: alpha/beta hydrolase [Oligoflexia bacterium]|nr:alpha/beta hydrolase [Oligoflexia bacterium]